MKALYARRSRARLVDVAVASACCHTCRRALSSSSSPSSSSPRDAYAHEQAEAAAEAAYDEDAMRVLQSRHRDFAELPLLHVLAQKADALERDLQRVRWCLYTRPQLLADTTAATLTGRPTRIDVVLRRCAALQEQQQQQQQQQQPHEATVRAATTYDNAALLRYTRWPGTSSPELRLYGWLRGLLPRTRRPTPPTPAQQQPDTSDHVPATLQSDVEYVTRVRTLHALNYYSRLNLTPKRHIGHALYHIVWNVYVGLVNALGCLVFATLRGALRSRVVAASSSSDIDDTAASTTSSAAGGGGLRGLLRGACCGVWLASQYLCYGWLVSPYVHLTRGLCNSCYGPLSALTGRYMFDASSGRWMRCTVVDAAALHRELRRERRVLRAIGRYEFARKRMRVEQKWRARMAMLGFSVEALHDKLQQAVARGGSDGGSNARRRAFTSSSSSAAAAADPYEVLRVPRSATTAQIKAQYKKLAMLYHPDVVAQHRRAAAGEPGSSSSTSSTSSNNNNNNDDDGGSDARAMFARVSSAYQVLSNPERRRAYDRAGLQGLRLYESRYGGLLTRTPEEMVQAIFGGEAFRCSLIGDLLRSHWSLRYEAAVSVSMHEFEELQCLRVRTLSVELARIADVHAKREHGSDDDNNNNSRRGASSSSTTAATTTAVPRCTNAYNDFTSAYEQRCERFVAQLAEACFGKELLYEVGEVYVVGAQRFLGVRPFYTPKLLQVRKAFAGMDRIWREFRANMQLERPAIDAKFMREFLSMEFDVVIADVHCVLRFVVQLVLCDAAESDAVRRRRAYAVWLLGEKMMARGQRWNSSAPVFAQADLLAYVQQAATSPASTRAPHMF